MKKVLAGIILSPLILVIPVFIITEVFFYIGVKVLMWASAQFKGENK